MSVSPLEITQERLPNKEKALRETCYSLIDPKNSHILNRTSLSRCCDNGSASSDSNSYSDYEVTSVSSSPDALFLHKYIYIYSPL